MVYQHGPLVKWSKTLASHASNMGSNPVRVTKKKAVAYATAFFNDVFRYAERDVHFVRDVRLRRVMCASRMTRNTSQKILSSALLPLQNT